MEMAPQIADVMPMLPVVGSVIVSFFGPHAVVLVLSTAMAGAALFTGVY